MAGPCSYPAQDRAEHARHNEIICDIHTNRDFVCDPAGPKMGKDGDELEHVWVTRRLWLAKRNRLTTGKTR